MLYGKRETHNNKLKELLGNVHYLHLKVWLTFFKLQKCIVFSNSNIKGEFTLFLLFRISICKPATTFSEISLAKIIIYNTFSSMEK